jgi:hypothetical protein
LRSVYTRQIAFFALPELFSFLSFANFIFLLIAKTVIILRAGYLFKVRPLEKGEYPRGEGDGCGFKVDIDGLILSNISSEAVNGGQD